MTTQSGDHPCLLHFLLVEVVSMHPQAYLHHYRYHIHHDHHNSSFACIITQSSHAQKNLEHQLNTTDVHVSPQPGPQKLYNTALQQR